MKAKKLVIYDKNKDYMEHFVEYMNREQNLFSVKGFSSWEMLKEETSLSKTDLFLADENMSIDEFDCLKESRLIVLSEGSMASWGQAFPHVYKFQSMDEIYRQILSFYWEEEEGELLSASNTGVIIGIYSPITRCLKTSLSFILAQILSREQSVLLINLEEFSGFPGLFQEKYNGDLSDAIYYFRHEKCFSQKILSLVYKGLDFDYLPPVEVPDDLYSCSQGELGSFLAELGKSSGYEVLIVDIGTGCGSLIEILSVCSRIYMPVLDSRTDSLKVGSFESYLLSIGMERMIEKIERIQTGTFLNTRNKNYQPQELLWSDFGDYIRHLIKGSPWNKE